MIPDRIEGIKPKERRFYVVTPAHIHLELQKEAFARDTDAWTLGGAVIQAWIYAGCPLDFDPGTIDANRNSGSSSSPPLPSPSLSVAGHKEPTE